MSGDNKNKQMVPIMPVMLALMITIIFAQWYFFHGKKEQQPVSPVLIASLPTDSAPQKKSVDVSGTVTNGIMEFRGDQTKLIF